MIHEVSTISFGKVEEIKSDAAETDRLNKLIFNLAARHVGKKDDYFLDLIHSKNHSEIYLNSKECKKHNICNHIGVPELVTNVSVTQTFSLNNKEILIPEKRKL
jgi:ATP-dependent protease ClpP protease subunit